MITRALLSGLLIGSVTLTATAADTDRPEHFQGQPSETLAEAVANFATYNGKLQSVLDQDTLDGEAISTVHQLTYTLETALAKINAELATLAETLETVHLASERLDGETVKRAGQAYLSVANEMIQSPPP